MHSMYLFCVSDITIVLLGAPGYLGRLLLVFTGNMDNPLRPTILDQMSMYIGLINVPLYENVNKARTNFRFASISKC